MLPPMRRQIFNCAPKVSRQYRPNRCRTARVGGIGQPFGGTVYGCVMAEVIISGWRSPDLRLGIGQRTRAEAVSTWHKHGLRHFVAGSAIGTVDKCAGLSPLLPDKTLEVRRGHDFQVPASGWLPVTGGRAR